MLLERDTDADVKDAPLAQWKNLMRLLTLSWIDAVRIICPSVVWVMLTKSPLMVATYSPSAERADGVPSSCVGQ